MRSISPCVHVAAAFVFVVSLGAQADDPHLGIWKLNQQRSISTDKKAKPHRVPAVLKIRPIDDGHRIVSVFVSDRGDLVRSEYAARYDGKEYPLNITIDTKAASGTVVSRRIDADTLEHTFHGPDGRTSVQLTIVSKDRRTRTHMTTGTDGVGQHITSVEVYDLLWSCTSGCE